VNFLNEHDVAIAIVLRGTEDSDTQGARDNARVRIEAAEEMVMAAARILIEVGDESTFAGGCLTDRERKKINDLRQYLADFRRKGEHMRADIRAFDRMCRDGFYDEDIARVEEER
jgi:hypothetical protein